jgi:hypothetical protein
VVAAGLGLALTPGLADAGTEAGAEADAGPAAALGLAAASISTVAGCPLTSSGCTSMPLAWLDATSEETRPTALLAVSYVFTDTVSPAGPALPEASIPMSKPQVTLPVRPIVGSGA